jgi:hypothetical protein
MKKAANGGPKLGLYISILLVLGKMFGQGDDRPLPFGMIKLEATSQMQVLTAHSCLRD